MFKLVVKGRGQFPIDMLRYDGCYPRHEADSGRIEVSFQRGNFNVEQQISLTLPGKEPPTEARWSSFGWTVVSCERDR